ncbi:MAG TPA: AIR synthase related protein [Actinomycetota bacterium]|nr:AIR synthase related protein [Actinomycetota bacterium]
MAADLATIARRFGEHPGLKAKAALHVVTEALGPTDWVAGPGDDAAALPSPDGTFLLVAGEAISPPFVAADPYGAGVAAVVANVNDIAAMGGRPTALVDTVTGREPAVRRALAGLRHAADLYQVPVAGGHLSLWDGPPSLSVFALGQAESVLSARNLAPGQSLLAAYCLDGTLRADFPFFSSIAARGAGLAADVRLLADLGSAGRVVAAKDISMAGTLGSLAMLLEPTGNGATVDLGRIPRPPGVALEDWLFAFPTFGFLLSCPAAGAAPTIAAFEGRGLACAAVGAIDSTGQLRAVLGDDAVTLIDLATTPVTGLGLP